MNWLSTIVRMAGNISPWTAALIQFQAELESDALLQRVKRLEDPISFLHSDVPAVSKIIYDAIKSEDSTNLDFEDEFYQKYSKSLACLDSAGYIRKQHVVGSNLPRGIEVSDASYILYLCAQFELKEKMDCLVEKIDKLKSGESLHGAKLHSELLLPTPVIDACFTFYEAKGYGFRSRTIGLSYYQSTTD